MKKIIILVITIFVFSSCKNEKELKVIEKPKPDSIEKLEIDCSGNPKVEKNQDDKLEAIEKENSEIIEQDEEYINKAAIEQNDSLIWLTVNMKRDHRIFGFEKPDVKSKRMILLSIFTKDVENNPFNCPYGAFYETSGMKNITLKFKENIGDFAKIEIQKENSKEVVYFEKKWLEFEQTE
ncbi:hypothetical protein [Flavobacterium sp. WC2509]|uniref:hypothetical protein n=1 Tax=Flavobacterium sp. WC2509 TaxID=3461406 RepID=UPI00404422E2